MKTLFLRTAFCFLWGSVSAVYGAEPFTTNSPELLPYDGVPYVFPDTSRWVAIGDLHADPDAFFTILEDRLLIDERGHWTGGDTQLVLMGDFVSRGWNSRLIFDLVDRLKHEAAAQGGAVHDLLGNHELLKVMGLYDIRHAERERYQYLDLMPALTSAHAEFEIRKFKAMNGGRIDLTELMELRAGVLATHGTLGYERAFAFPLSPYFQAIARRNSMIVIGRTLFVHAGFESWLKDKSPDYLGRMNSTLRAFMRESNLHQNRMRFSAPLPHWAIHSDGPLWTRKLSRRLLPTGMVMRTLRSLGVDRVVIGHQVTDSRDIESSYRGMVWRVDTGISAAMGGKLSALEYRPGAEPEPINQIPRQELNPLRAVLDEEFSHNRPPLHSLTIDFKKIALSCIRTLAEQ